MNGTSNSAKGVVWVTGAGSGIGRGLAKKLAQLGWSVAVSARTASDLEELAAEVPERIAVFPVDVTDEIAVARTVNSIEASLGEIDLAVLNAGSYFPVTAKDFSVANFRKTIDINLMGTIHCIGPLAPKMIARRSGHIAIMASVAGFVGLPTSASYGATKAALNNMAEALKPEFEAEGVTLTVINPGFVRTPATDKNSFPMPFMIDVDEAVDDIVKGLDNKQFEITFPWQMALSMRTLRMLPHWLLFTITRRMLPKRGRS